MINRILFSTVVIAAVIFGASCSFNVSPCPADLNTQFQGCFEGVVTDPVDGGKMTLIVEAVGAPESTYALSGCLELSLASGVSEFVTLSGGVSCGEQAAHVTGMLTSGQTVTLNLTRQPAGSGDAVTLDVTAEGGIPFVSAVGLSRCGVPRTCDDLGMIVPFAPGGQP